MSSAAQREACSEARQKRGRKKLLSTESLLRFERERDRGLESVHGDSGLTVSKGRSDGQKLGLEGAKASAAGSDAHHLNGVRRVPVGALDGGPLEKAVK